jgi:DNA polymerase-4
VRKIVHIDMDAFYAAVEQRDDPRLRGAPLAVGSPGERGVVLTASYEARTFGVRSAMPSTRARRLCPELQFVRPRFDAYRRESRRIRAVMERFTGLIEPVSLDEAYLDVTEPLTGAAPAVEVARAIKTAIRTETGLTASAGVSFNKFLAKIASDLEKPDGLTVIRPERALSFLAGLPIERFHGVGPATARRMRAMGIHSGADLQARPEQELAAAFGRLGRHYWRIAQGLDERPVEPDRPRRSLSVETTFDRDIGREEELVAALEALAPLLAERLERAGFSGRTLTLKLRYADFKVMSRRATRAAPFVGAREILAAGRDLLLQRPRPGDPLRLLGLGVSCGGAEEDPRQLPLPLKGTRSAGP